MAGKRQATTNLNHENWDQEEEPEERGTFRKASDDELKNRVIKKARRKVAGKSGTDATDDSAPNSVFSGFAGFGKSASTAPASSPFSFLSKISAPVDGNNASVTAKSTANFSFGSATKPPISSDIKDVSAENQKFAKEDPNVIVGKSSIYKSKIKSLNQAVTEWIKTHVDKNPLCILSPIFKDYEKYIEEIEEEENKLEKSADNTGTNDKLSSTSADKFKFSSSPAKLATTTASAAGATISFGPSPTASASSSSIFTGGSKTSTETTKTNTFSFGLKSAEDNYSGKDAKPSEGFIFGLKPDDKPLANVSTFTFGKPTTTNGESTKKPALFSFTPGSTPFSFGNIKPPAAIAPSTSDGANGADDEEDEPPKVEFKQVVEEDAVFSKKCKVFVKKDGAFADRGVGTLYLKPVKDSEKMQLLVRADTSLGNILVNLILSAGIPTQRMGKNNVMMVCLPTPDVEKATSMLLRVKTAEEADELLAELDKHKK